jgi:predicted glutamine amidotransferase
MCRFLMVKSAGPLAPQRFLEAFADLSEQSPAPDGGPQADGWGISWVDAAGRWNARKFPDPIWESAGLFGRFPESRCFCLHARSASAPAVKNDVEFNQPFVDGRYAFVFNGFLEGISLPYPVPGRLGSQKIWALLRARLKASGCPESLREIKDLLNRRSRRVQALNIGLNDGDHLYGLCQYAGHEDYYRCRVHVSPGLRMICSGPLEGFDFRPAPVSRVFAL